MTAEFRSVQFARRSLAPLLLSLGLAYCLAGCVTVTNDSLSQNRDPDKATKLYVETAIRYMQTGKMANANLKLLRAQELSPNDPGVNNALALFYNIEGDITQAEKHFKQAISADPKFSQARNNYAVFLFSQQRYEDARQQLEVVVKDYMYPKRFAAFENLGVCYRHLSMQEEAIEAFNRALQINGRLPVSLLEMTAVYMKQGDNLLASRYLKQYESFAPSTARHLWLGIQLQRRLGDQDRLASYALALKNLFPGSEEYKAYSNSL